MMTRITDVYICATRSQWWTNYSSDAVSLPRWCIMTSLNGDIFCITDPSHGEFTGDRWLPRIKASDAKLWHFLWFAPEQTAKVINRHAGDLRRHRARSDVTVMAIVWCLSLSSLLTPYNITFPFGTFINTRMLCNIDWYWNAAYNYMQR